MKHPLNKILALGTLGAAALVVGSGLRMMRHVKKSLQNREPPLGTDSPSQTYPKVALMVPCKGLDPDFELNMQRLLEQDYPNFEIVFMTINAQDPCHPVLQELVTRSPVPARLVLGGFSKQRCQKLDNILAGVDAIGEQADIYAWADSDARVARDWLRQLVAPLRQPHIGASTTYRWYRPEPGRPLTYVLALWTGIQITHFHINKTVAVWGGSMAIRRATFEALEMRRIWQTALADDCVLNDTVRKAGLRVEFVVPAMTSLSSEHPVKEILIFAVRQCVIGKHTLKGVWWISVSALSFFHLALGRGLWLAGRSALQRQPVPLVAWGMLSFIPAGILQSLSVIQCMRQIAQLREADDPLEAHYPWALFAPPAYAFVWLTLAASALTDRFVWRDIYYRMLNAHETEVYAYPAELESATSEEETPSGAHNL